MQKKTKISQIKIGAIISYISIGVNILAGLFYTPWMVNQIGKSDYGLFTLANSIITLFLLDFGLSSATSRFVAKYRAEHSPEKINNFLGIVYKLYILIDIFIFIIFTIIFINMNSIYVNLSSIEIEKLKIVFLIAGGYSLFNFPFVTLNGILNAYEKFVQLKLADLLYRFLVVGLMIWALSTGHGLYSLVIVNVISGIAIISYKLVIIKCTIPIKVNLKARDNKLLKDIFGFSIWITISTIAQRLIFNITPTILGIVANSSSIAVFGIITTIEGYVYLITTAINGMFMPRISKMFAEKNEKSNLLPLMINVGRFQFFLNCLIVIGFALVGRLFIQLWMGGEYMDAYYGLLLVLLPGLIFNSLQIANTTMIVANMVKKQAMIMVLSAVINVSLSLIFSYELGVIGSCISIFIAYMFRAIAYIVITHVNLEINMFHFIRHGFIRIIIAAAISIFLSILLYQFCNFSGWLELIVKGGIFALTFTLLTLLIVGPRNIVYKK